MRAIRHPALLLLAIALVATVGLRGAALSQKYTVEHDEAISYLAATCNEGRWEALRAERAYPFGSWATASAWQQFLEPRSALCLGQIRDDLARHDIHPPLYFWLLHLSVLALGVHVWTGPALNLVLATLGTLALFGLARRLLGRATEAAVVALVWAASPAVVTIAGEARQYELFALVTIVFAWQAISWVKAPRPGWRDASLLAAATTAGALTHYHFALVALAGGCFLAFRLRGELRRLATGIGWVAAGYAGFVLLHPRFHLSFETQQAQAEPFSAAAVAGRVERTLGTLGNFLLPQQAASGPLLRYLVPGVLAVAAAMVLAARRCRAAGASGVDPSRERHSRGGSEAKAPLEPLYFFASIGGAIVLLYLAFLSHGFAMGAKYLAPAWPFLAFVPVLALRGGVGRHPVAGVALCSALVASGLAAALLQYRGAARPQDPAGLVPGASPVLIDSSRRGVVPRFVVEVPPERRILAVDQRFLLEARAPWLASGTPPLVYVSDELYGDERRQAEIVGLLGRRHSVTRLKDGDWGKHRIFAAWHVRPRTPARAGP